MGPDTAVQPSPPGHLRAFPVSLAVCGHHSEAVGGWEVGVEH